MKVARVGIFGRKVDRQVTDLRDALARLGAEPVVVDFHNFPRFNLATLGRRACTFDDLNLPHAALLTDLDLVHLRGACFEDLPAEATPAGHGERDPLCAGAITAHYRQQVARLSVQLGLARRLARRVPVINPPDAFLFHRRKAHQHALLARHGAPVPRTLVTSDLAHARAFAGALPGGAVVKPLAGGAEVVMADEAFFQASARTAGRRPYIFQQYVKGRSMRAYLLGGRVVSMGELIHDRARVDWREHVQRAAPCAPSATLAVIMSRAARLLDMPCCGMDLEQDEITGATYLLDFNPSALYASWARMTDTDMAGLLAEYLMQVVRRLDPWSST